MDILIAITMWLLIGFCALVLSAALIVARGKRWSREAMIFGGVCCLLGPVFLLLAAVAAAVFILPNAKGVHEP
ncbi:MAG: hypothetical protein NTV86_04435 [Planctomycetota bacterium]|nr:hypothetical protein [Planctomycetota bacterium]